MRKIEILNAKEARKKVTTLVLTGLMCCPMMSQAQTLQINVNDAQFTRQMMERLVIEYNKVNPGFSATITSDSEQADAKVSLSTQYGNENIVGRFVILPIANSQNEILSIRRIAKGLDDKLKRQIFVERDAMEELEAEEEGERKLPGTVYSLTGSRAITTQIVARDLKTTPNRIRGQKILGREKNLINIVQNHPDAISFNVASLIYDTSTHKPLNGLTILPVDLDGNGKISDEERTAINSLDELTAYLAKSSHTGLPSGSIYISTDNLAVKQFLNWATTQGQDYLAQYGFLKAENSLTAQK